jgi:hypothetical protein
MASAYLQPVPDPAEQRLDEGEAIEVAHKLTYGLVKKRLPAESTRRQIIP